MHWIPDVPKIIQDQIERENLITQRALWEVKPELRSPSITYSSLALNKDKSFEEIIKLGKDLSNFNFRTQNESVANA